MRFPLSFSRCYWFSHLKKKNILLTLLKSCTKFSMFFDVKFVFCVKFLWNKTKKYHSLNLGKYCRNIQNTNLYCGSQVQIYLNTYIMSSCLQTMCLKRSLWKVQTKLMIIPKNINQVSHRTKTLLNRFLLKVFV